MELQSLYGRLSRTARGCDVHISAYLSRIGAISSNASIAMAYDDSVTDWNSVRDKYASNGFWQFFGTRLKLPTTFLRGISLAQKC